MSLSIPPHLGVKLSAIPEPPSPRRPTTVGHRGLLPDVSAQAGDVKKPVAQLKTVLRSIPTVMSSIRACQHPKGTQRDVQTSKTSWEQATEVDDERGHNLCGHEEGMNGQEEPQAPVISQRQARPHPIEELHGRAGSESTFV